MTQIKRRTLNGFLRKEDYKKLIRVINNHIKNIELSGEVYPSNASEDVFLTVKKLIYTLFRYTNISAPSVHLPYKDYLELFVDNHNDFMSLCVNDKHIIDYVIQLKDREMYEGVCKYNPLYGKLPEELLEIFNER
jgi:hypothetical protein